VSCGLHDVVAFEGAGRPAVLIASSEAATAELGWRPQHTDIAEIVGDAWRFTQSRQPV